MARLPPFPLFWPLLAVAAALQPNGTCPIAALNDGDGAVHLLQVHGQRKPHAPQPDAPRRPNRVAQLAEWTPTAEFLGLAAKAQRYFEHSGAAGVRPEKSEAFRHVALLAEAFVKSQPADRAAAGASSVNTARPEWTNVLGDIVQHPLAIVEAKSMQDLVEAHAFALRENLQLKAVGAGHSWSDATRSTGVLVATLGLNRVANAESPIFGQLQPSMLRSSALPLVRLGDGLPWAKDDYDPEQHVALFETEGGIRVRQLNAALEGAGLALRNMGGADFQTVAGYVSTGTHGSGLRLGPMAHFVRSLVLVTTGQWTSGTGPTNLVPATGPPDAAGVYIYRIELYDGPSDPSKYSDPKVTLLQNDAAFQAVTVSFGTMGVIYSMVLETMQFYWLKMEARHLTWGELVQEFQPVAPSASNPLGAPAAMADNRHVTIWVNPYMPNSRPEDPVDHTKLRAVVFSSNIVPKPKTPTLGSILDPQTFIQVFLVDGLAKLRFDLAEILGNSELVFKLTAAIFNTVPGLVPWLIAAAMETGAEVLAREAKWYEVLRVNLGPDAGIFMESIVPTQTNTGAAGNRGAFEIWPATLSDAGAWRVDLLDRQIRTTAEVAALQRRLGNWYITSPMFLRFVQATDRFMSMSYGSGACHQDITFAYGTYNYYEMYQRIFAKHLQDGARFHWGKHFPWLQGFAQIGEMYPELPSFKQELQKFNALGTYSNVFTATLGLTS